MPRSFGEAAETNGQNPAAEICDILPSRSTSSG